MFVWSVADRSHSRGGLSYDATLFDTQDARLLVVALGRDRTALECRGRQRSVVDPGSDPRVGLAGGHWVDAGEAISNLNFVAHKDRPSGYFNPEDRGDLSMANTDITFRDNFLFQGNGRGVMIWDISDPANPTLRSATVCPGGQGDVSVYSNLLFVSTEGLSGRIDCGAQGVPDTVSAERMRGVRIYDISDIDHPKQVAAVQTCRGSHTNTVVPDPVDKNVVYVYVQGISRVRPAAELAGCSGLPTRARS